MKKIWIRFLACFVLLVGLDAGLIYAMPNSGKNDTLSCKVTYDVNVREDASINSNLLCQVKKGEVVKILEEKNDFGKILFEGNVGWITSKNYKIDLPASDNIVRKVGSVYVVIFNLNWSAWIVYPLLIVTIILFIIAKDKGLAEYVNRGFYIKFLYIGAFLGFIFSLGGSDKVELYFNFKKVALGGGLATVLFWIIAIFLFLVLLYQVKNRESRRRFPFSLLVGVMLFLCSLLLVYKICISWKEIVEFFIGILVLIFLIYSVFSDSSTRNSSSSKDSDDMQSYHYDVEVDFLANVTCSYYGYQSGQWNGCSKEYNESGICDAKYCYTGDKCNGGCVIINKSR